MEKKEIKYSYFIFSLTVLDLAANLSTVLLIHKIQTVAVWCIYNEIDEINIEAAYHPRPWPRRRFRWLNFVSSFPAFRLRPEFRSCPASAQTASDYPVERRVWRDDDAWGEPWWSKASAPWGTCRESKTPSHRRRLSAARERFVPRRVCTRTWLLLVQALVRPLKLKADYVK